MELRSILSGEADDSLLEKGERHLEGCSHCCDRAEALSSTLDSRMRGLVRADPSATDPLQEQLKALLEPSTASERFLGRIGNYEVEHLIARGGMGIVIKAWDPALERTVAIKLLAPELAEIPEARERFLREARAVALLDHRNVLPVFSVDQNHEPPYLVMAYNDGETLAQLLEAEGAMPFEKARDLSVAVAAGLQAAHDQGLIHRDIKPANILISRDRSMVRLADFGLARSFEASSVTASGVVSGTPLYMSPEQLDGEDIDHRSDLFSMGSVFYALVTGKAPFGARSTIATIKKIVLDDPEPISSTRSDVPDWFAELVDDLLKKDPEVRLSTAAEVVSRLESAGLSSDKERPSANTASGWWRAPWVWVGLVSAVLLAGIFRANRDSGELEWKALSSALSSQTSLSDFRVAEGRFREGKIDDGMALLCRALRRDPGNRLAARALLHELAYRARPPGGKVRLLEPRVLECGAPIREIGFTSGRDLIFAFSTDGMIHSFMGPDFEMPVSPFRWPGGATMVTPSARGAFLAFVTEGNRYWFLNHKKRMLATFTFTSPGIHSVAALTPDDQYFLVGTKDGRLHVWKFGQKERLAEWGFSEGAVTMLEVSSDSRKAVAVTAPSLKPHSARRSFCPNFQT
ncbi:MAG: protein kinase [Verrucomicrobiota bacterium]